YVFTFASDGPILFAGAWGTGVFKSTDGGMNWWYISPLPFFSCVSLCAKGSLVFAGTQGSGIFSSLDSGVTWTQQGQDLPVDANITTISILDSELFASADGQLFVSSDSGGHWQVQPGSGRSGKMSALH